METVKKLDEFVTVELRSLPFGYGINNSDISEVRGTGKCVSW